MKEKSDERECYHCRQWVKDPKTHDCWTTTEEKLTADLPEYLMEAWERLRETADAFGEQRIYASHKSIMFSRKACYFFVRPKKNVLEVCIFLGRELKNPLVKKTGQASKVKTWNLVHISHRDQVEEPITDWLREAYEASVTLKALPRKAKKEPPPRRKKKKKTKPKIKKKK